MKKQRWFLPTNTENLEIFLSQGAVSCAEGLGAAYVRDVMSDYPLGYIPFFLEGSLSNAVKKSQVDDENLITCIIELDFSQILNMNIFVGLLDNAHKKIDILKLSEEDCESIFLPSPLPLQCIKNIIFETTVEKKEASQQLGYTFGTFPDKFLLGGGKNKKLFKVNDDNASLLSIDNSSVDVCILNKKINYDKIFSLGGMLGLMFYQTKNGRESISSFEEACKLTRSVNSLVSDYALINGFFTGKHPQLNDSSLLTYKILGVLSENRTSSIGEIRQEILDYLNSDQGHSTWAVSLQRIVDRHQDYMSPEGLFSKLIGSYSMKENNSQKKLLMILTMYFFRDNTETMLKFYHEDFKQVDYILFSMFFGIGNHYIGLPESIKKIRGLNFYISNCMAEYAHCENGIQVFKKIDKPKFIMKNIIKEKVDNNHNYDKFINWYCGFTNTNSSKLMTWKQSKLKGIQIDEKGEVTHFYKRPTIATKIDINNLERQILASTIGNDKDLFDFNMVYDKYASIMK
jgi:hypothetical protein